MSELAVRRKKEAIRKVLVAFFSILIVCSVALSDKIAVNAASNPFSKYLSSGKINCTWYAWQAAYDRMGVALPMLGNGGQWIDGAKKYGIPYGSVAKPNSIAVWTNSGAGHVAYVTRVEGSYMWVDEGGRGSSSYPDGVATNQKRLSAIGSYQFSKGDSSLVGFVYLEQQKDTTPPTIEQFKIESQDDDYVTFSYVFGDNVGVVKTVTTLYGPNITKEWTDTSLPCDSKKYIHTWKYKWKDNPNGNYQIKVTMWDAAGNSYSANSPVATKNTIYNPNIAFDAAYENGEGMVTVTGWAFDKDDVNKNLTIHVYEFRDGQSYFLGETIADGYRSDVNDAFGCGNYHGFSATFPSTLGGNVDINVAALNIGPGDNTWGTQKTVYITPDIKTPVISDVNVTDITNEGYTVTCKVSDNVKIKKIEFPSWTIADGQDDLTWHVGTITDGVATCRIDTSAHGNQIDQDYITVIYAWDYMDNQTCVSEKDYPCLSVNVRDTVTVTAIHYKEKLNGTYSKAAEVTYQRKPGETITPPTKKYTGFTAPKKQKVTVKADGSTVVEYYYTRNSYNLTWDFAGGKASGEYTKGSVKYGAKITVPTPKRTGYTFKGWDIEVPAKMPANDVTIKAKWQANTTTPYTVEHYRQKTDGTYTSTPTESESFTGKTNATVTPEVKTYKGFTSPEATSVKIKADGKLVVKYYYTRNSYKLTWNLDGGTASGSYTKGNVKYGAKITAPKPVKEGYVFAGWDKTVSEKMPAKNVTYTAQWRKLSQEEQVEAFVERFYVIILDRPAEPKGLNDWTTSLIDKKKTGADVAAGFINSSEFQNKNMSDEEYLTKLYLAFFDREPDKAGFESWKKELKNGKSRDYVLGGFINSVEFNNLCKKYGIRTGSY